MELDQQLEEDNFISAISEYVGQIQFDFIELIQKNSKDKNLMWTLYNAIRMNIIPFMQTYLFDIIEGNQQPEQIITLKDQIKSVQHKKRVMQQSSYQLLIKNYFAKIQEHGGKSFVIQRLIQLICEPKFLSHLHNVNSRVKVKMIALLFYAYVHSQEYNRGTFNILSVWGLIFPKRPMWKIQRDEPLEEGDQLYNDLLMLEKQFSKCLHLEETETLIEKEEQQKNIIIPQFPLFQLNFNCKTELTFPLTNQQYVESSNNKINVPQ